MALLLALLLQSTDDLVAKLADADDAVAAAAAGDLVKQGKEARAAVAKAMGSAKAALKPRYEEVLLRIDAGVDETAPKISEMTVDGIAEWFLDTVQGQKVAHIKVAFRGDNAAGKEQIFRIVGAELVTLKERIKLVTEANKQPFEKAVPAGAAKNLTYGNMITPKWAAGTRAVFVFEIKVGDATAKLRTNVVTLAAKKE
jgi:hypothetical protein